MRRLIVSIIGVFITVGILHAAWWKFGRKKAIPEITSLYICKIDARDIEEGVYISPSDLEGGLIVIKGKAEMRKGKIARVKISLDGGKTWEDAKVKEGSFIYSFRPEMGREYEFQIYAIDTTGKKSDPHDWEFKITFGPEIGKEEVVKVFQRMLRNYMRENLPAFMQDVSENFRGDLSALEDALEKDFRFFDNIRINVSIVRIVKSGKDYKVYFVYNRQLTSSKTGRVLKDRSTSTAAFEVTPDKKVKLVELSAPLIFGVSEPEDVATSVTPDAVGTKVIVVDEEGNAGLKEQPETVQAEEEIGEYEEVSLLMHEFFDFESEEKNQGWCEGDIGFEPWEPQGGFICCGDSGIVLLNYTDLDDVKECPTGGYEDEIYIQVGACYCVKTDSGKYAKIKVISSSADGPVVFEYAVSNTRYFE